MASLLISNVTTAPINKVIQYNKDDFAKILKSGFTYNIEDSTLKIIQAIADQVGAPEYIKTPKFDNQTQNLENHNKLTTIGNGYYGYSTTTNINCFLNIKNNIPYIIILLNNNFVSDLNGHFNDNNMLYSFECIIPLA